MSEWQPIETVPKDGTPVDIWHPSVGRIVGVWYDSDDGWPQLPDYIAREMTHWMPLPAPPTT